MLYDSLGRSSMLWNFEMDIIRYAKAVATKQSLAGSTTVTFSSSSWSAVYLLGMAHSNAIYVLVTRFTRYNYVSIAETKNKTCRQVRENGV